MAETAEEGGIAGSAGTVGLDRAAEIDGSDGCAEKEAVDADESRFGWGRVRCRRRLAGTLDWRRGPTGYANLR